MIKLSFRPGAVDRLTHDLEQAVERLEDSALRRVADKAEISIVTLSAGKLELDVKESRKQVTIAAYGPRAVEIEQQLKPFQITYDSMPNIIKTIKW